MINEEKDTENSNEEEMSRDKIFGNDFGASDFDLPTTKFSIEDSRRERKIDELIDEQITKDVVISLIESHSKFKRLLIPDENGEYIKVNKSEINEIYSYTITNLKSNPKVEVFSILIDMFDISPEKFYESLSNTFKTQLIIELRDRGYLKRRNFLF
jgi:hypothetical protein